MSRFFLVRIRGRVGEIILEKWFINEATLSMMMPTSAPIEAMVRIARCRQLPGGDPERVEVLAIIESGVEIVRVSYLCCTYDGLKRKWMLLQFHDYDDGIIREIGTSASGEGCINSRTSYGENEQHHVHDPHEGSKLLHDSDGLVALISDSGSDSGVGSSTSDWSDVKNQGVCGSHFSSADNTETELASAERGTDTQVYDRVADSSTGSGPSMSLRDSTTANQERVRLTVCQASVDNDGSSRVVGDFILVVPCNGDFGATPEVIAYIKPMSGR
ncbi:hypothetical protein QAD02_007533 [Eretmocerus hayati]|uniref:Uncharacterized protein n=1 Tax=Eretmocerus hayati TaxID=131215 RepID=A0ACC2N477_9HYME|nr:hypothetical protein QAD02_007533 [Eretmocerus hayati]